MEPITIVIADDHALVRSGLRQLLELEPDMTVIGEAGDADAALELARDRGPRVLLLDLSMPGTPSLEAIPGFVGLWPAPAVVVLTAYDEQEFAREALAAGASAYVLKDAAETHIVEAIRAAVAGRAVPRSRHGRQARDRGAARPPPRPVSSRSARRSRGTASTASRDGAAWASSTGPPISRSIAVSRSS